MGCTEKEWQQLQAQSAANTRQSTAPIVKQIASLPAWKTAGFDSDWEMDFNRLLQQRLGRGEIKAFLYHPANLNIMLWVDKGKEKRVRYTPDFLVWELDGSTSMIEIKGFWRKADKVRFKGAMAAFPLWTWMVAKKVNGQFHMEKGLWFS